VTLPTAWYDLPQPWVCSRCDRVFDAEDWHNLGEWIGTVQIDAYGPALCRKCFVTKRLLDVVLAFDPMLTVEPTPPGWSIRARPGRIILTDENHVVREVDGRPMKWKENGE
jgi:hypothetical protein